MITGRNLINGERPEFGNLKHIAFCQRVAKIFKGDLAFHKIEWDFCTYWGSQTDTGKPKFKFVDFKKADAVVDYIPCPKCQKNHVLLVAYDPRNNWYDNLISIDMHVKEFHCWNCKCEFEVDEDRYVFVKI